MSVRLLDVISDNSKWALLQIKLPKEISFFDDIPEDEVNWEFLTPVDAQRFINHQTANLKSDRSVFRMRWLRGGEIEIIDWTVIQ